MAYNVAGGYVFAPGNIVFRLPGALEAFFAPDDLIYNENGEAIPLPRLSG